MKQLWHMIERYYPWLLLLLGVDCFCAVILWISDIQAFQTLIGLVVLTSILLFSAILFVLNKRENTHMELFRDFLSDPTICNEERLLSAISQKEGESVRFLASVLREYKNESNNMADALRDYEEYVEGWAHEAKTPLSLLTMLLDNRNDEISPSLQAKLDYVRSQLQEDVTQMLYYARLKSSTKDYRFEDVNLNDCLGEVLEDYAPLLEEKQFVILNKLQSETVYTDRRGLQFMLGQIVSNAIKYSSDSPMLTISMIHSETADVLSVEDNGIGVKKYDLPYIFQKGFTGDSTDSRKKATLFIERSTQPDAVLFSVVSPLITFTSLFTASASFLYLSMQFYYTTLPKHYKYNSVGMLYFFISLIFIFLYSISLSKCLESNIDSIDNWRLYFNNSLVIPTPHSNLFLSLTTLVGAWQQHRNLTSASYSRRAGLNY